MDTEEKEALEQDTSSGNGTMLEQASGHYENISMEQSDSGVGGQPSPGRETDVDTGAPVEQEPVEQEVMSEVTTTTVQSPADEEYFSITSEPKIIDQSYQSIDSDLYYSLPEKSPASLDRERETEIVYEEVQDQPDGLDKVQDQDDGLYKVQDQDDDDDDNIGSVSDEESFEDTTKKLPKRSTDTDDLMQGYRDDGSSVVSDIFTDVSAALNRLNAAYKSAISKEPKSGQQGSRFDSLRSKYTMPRTLASPRQATYVNVKPVETGYQSLLPKRDYHPYTSYSSSSPLTSDPQLEYTPEPTKLYLGEDETDTVSEIYL